MLKLNRMAVILSAKQPMLDWLRSVDPTNYDLTFRDLNRDPSVYLPAPSG